MYRLGCGADIRATVAGVVLCLGTLVEGPAAAANFEWAAPPGCPADVDVRARVEKDLESRLALLPDMAFAARARKTRRGYELVLTVRRDQTSNERRVRAQTCEELVDVLVAAMSLAIDSLAPEVDPEPEPSPPPTDEEPGPIPEPPRLRPAPRAKSAPGLQSRSSPTLSGWVNVSALLEIGSLPGPALGGEAGVAVGTRTVRGRVYGILVPKQRFELEGTAQGDFDLLAGGAGLCHSPTRPPFQVQGCVQGELGRLRGVGVQVSNPRQGRAIWFAVVPELWLLVRPLGRGWGAYARVGLPIPAYGQPFELTDIGTVHTPASPGLRAALGLEVELR